MIDITKVPEITIAYSNKVPFSERIKISKSGDIAELMRAWWHKFSPDSIEHHESFAMAMLNYGNYILGAKCIAVGGVAGTVVDVKIIAQHAIKANASSIILCHNHPSGNTQPSEQDIAITVMVAKGLGTLGIKVLDHVIITEHGYLSFQDEGIHYEP